MIPHDHDENQPYLSDTQHLTTNDARQGETGNGVRYIVIAALAVELIALALVWYFMSHTSS